MDARGEAIKDVIQGCYGMDIRRAHAKYTMRSYTFIWDDEPNMIRVFVGHYKSREEVMSEMLWADGLKQSVMSVCEPIPSLNGNLVEEYNRAGEHYRITQFKKPDGSLTRRVDPMYFLAVGETLGRIHKAAMKDAADGFRFKCTRWDIRPEDDEHNIEKLMPEEIRKKCLDTLKRVKQIPEDARWFGMIHGDYNSNNFLVDMNNIWVFDFDSCCYGYFMYDIAVACRTWLLQMINRRPRKNLLYEDILPYFKYGYSLHVKLPEEQWELLPLFIELRQIEVACGKIGLAETVQASEEAGSARFACMPLAYNDIFRGIDAFAIKLLSALGKDEAEGEEE